MIDSVQLRVAGLLDAPDPMVRSGGVIVTTAEAARFLGRPATSFVAVKIRDWRNDRKRAAELEARLPGYRVRTWHEMAQAVLSVSATKQKFSSAMVLFLVLIAMVGIVNTMLMSVFEKTREIGTMKALGMRDRDVLRLFLFEGSLVGVLGALCGALGGCLLTWYFAVHGLDFSSMAKGIDTSSLRMGTVIYAAWNIPSIAASFAACVGLSLVASWYPAKKAVALQAAECLRTN
jgi:putative ABC transport system permease protein